MKLTVLGGKRKFTQDCRAFEIEATLTWLIAYTLVTNCCNLRKKPAKASKGNEAESLSNVACPCEIGLRSSGG